MPTPTQTPPANAAQHNAAIAVQLANQGREDLIPGNTSEGGEPTSALDKLAAEVSAAHDPAKIAADAAAAKAAEETAAAEKAAAEKAEADKKSAAAGTPPADVTPPLDAPSAEVTARAEAIFKDTPQLPAGASPKASESFAAIKAQAVKEISQREAELEKLRTDKAALEEKLKNPIPPEIEKELEDHRTWRAKLDVDADPKFKEFDKTISASHEFIYAQLQKSPVVTPEIIAQIKSHGGPEFVQMGKLFEAIKDSTMQRLIESKLADIEMAKFNKDQAIKTTKDNIQKYIGDKAAAFTTAATQHTTVTKQKVEQLLGQLPWNKEKTVASTADAATKKAAEDYNEFLKTTRQQLADALHDDTPEMRAILLTGTAQLFHLQREHASTEAQLAAVIKELAETKAQWEKVKAASTTRLRESAANPGATIPPKPASEQVNVRPGDALDALAQQVMATRAAAGAK